MPAGGKPDWTISVLSKSDGRRGDIGAAWNNADGSISIRFNPCVTVTDSPDLVMRLFPYRTREERAAAASAPKNRRKTTARPGADSDTIANDLDYQFGNEPF